jgi:hypothetical protein
MTQPREVNESAATLKWLMAQLGLDAPGDDGPVRSAWSGVREAMQARTEGGQRIVQAVDWISDYWIARGALPVPGMGQLAPVWMPPDGLGEWPGFGVGAAIAPLADRATRSNRGAFAELLSATPAPPAADSSAAEALDAYLTLKAALVPRVWDRAAVVSEHVRVWLAACVGHLLMAIPLSPPDQLLLLGKEALRRLSIPAQLARQLELLDDLGDRQLEILYNARLLPDGRVSLGRLRTGQGEEWRDHWLALGFELDAEGAIEALRMASRMMRSPALILGLAAGIAADEADVRIPAVGVVRRWLLTLQAMAWLEQALGRDWVDVRPRDLWCFAVNATKPDWPRRVVAVSHRSRDVKPALRQMEVWRQGRFAIDANYVPSWESNTGMIWGLFAAPPAIVRVHSASYAESEWCRRERELTDYVRDVCDFRTGRWVLDLEEFELRRLDDVARVWRDESAQPSPGPLPEFPPLTEISSPAPMPVWETRLLRASAALRLMSVFVGGEDPELVNTLALHLQGDGPLPDPAPTNNPDGWRAYRDVLLEACEACGVPPTELAVRLPSPYDPSQRELDRELGGRIPDLQTGTPSLRDVLVASEWLRVEYPQLVDRRRGDFLAINCQRCSRGVWETAEELSLHRGLAGMRSRLPVPLWIIQEAGQDVEFWPLVGDVPIFTEHVSAQFAWMLEAAFDRGEAQRRYPTDSGLVLAPAAAARCRGEGG